MKNQFYKYNILFVLLMSLNFSIYSQTFKGYLLVDHNAVQQFNSIPDGWLDQAKELTLHYGTASHGTQLLTGVKYLEENVDAMKYSVAFFTFEPDPPRLPNPEVPPALRISAQGSHPEDYWNGIDGMNQTRNAANTGYFNFSMYAFCGEMASASEEYCQAYLDSLAKLEIEYPSMRFIYMTDYTDGNPAWSKLSARNNQIRQYCINNNKILYDFADIESYDPDGNYYPNVTAACEWCEDWCSQHPDDCANVPESCDDGFTTCCPHSHGFNCVIKGRALWWMMARLAGWEGTLSDPDTIPPDAPINMVATTISDQEIRIIWETAQDNINVVGYNIYRDNTKIDNTIDTTYTDSGLQPLTTYTYQVSAYDAFGNESSKSDPDTATTKKKKLVNITENNINDSSQLIYNYPNPFNSTTRIYYKLLESENISLIIYNTLGEEIKTLVNRKLPAGIYYIDWDGKDNHEQLVVSGLYIYQLMTDSFIKSKRMILLR